MRMYEKNVEIILFDFEEGTSPGKAWKGVSIIEEDTIGKGTNIFLQKIGDRRWDLISHYD